MLITVIIVIVIVVIVVIVIVVIVIVLVVIVIILVVIGVDECKEGCSVLIYRAITNALFIEGHGDEGDFTKCNVTIICWNAKRCHAIGGSGGLMRLRCATGPVDSSSGPGAINSCWIALVI